MVAAQIRDGQLANGMTRAEAAMARGYPPFHQTKGLGAETWLFYEGPDTGSYVTFSGERIAGIRIGETP